MLMNFPTNFPLGKLNEKSHVLSAVDFQLVFRLSSPPTRCYDDEKRNSHPQVKDFPAQQKNGTASHNLIFN